MSWTAARRPAAGSGMHWHDQVLEANPGGLPDHEEVAGAAPRAAAAVRPADAERREGVDHARGDRPALRGAPRELRFAGPDVAGVRLAESVQQDPRDHRSGWTGRRDTAAVRVGGDP